MILNLTKSKPDKNSYIKSEITKHLLPLNLHYGVRHISHNDNFRKVIIIKNIASNSELLRFKKLAQLKNTTLTMRLNLMQEYHIKRLIDIQINNKKVKRGKSKTTEQIQADNEIDEIIRFYKEIISQGNKIYYCNIFVEVYGSSPEHLNNNIKNVQVILSTIGVTYENLNHYQKEGFFSVFPLGKDHFKELANNIPTNTIASFSPFSYSARIDQQGMLLGKTEDGGNMFVDFWQRSHDVTNGNFFIVGQSGQGKSYLMKKIVSMQRMRDFSVFVLDPEAEYVDMVKNMDGTVIDCACGKVKINPFHVRILKTDYDDDLNDENLECFNQNQIFFQHISWLKDFFKVLYPAITLKELEALIILTIEMYRDHGIDENTQFESLTETQYPTFTTLYKYIENQHINYDNSKFIMISKDLISSILLVIKDSYDGSLGYLFNGHTNINNNKFICFNIHSLLTGDENRTQAVIFNIMTYIWNRISLKKENILFDIDELNLIMEPTILKYISSFSRRARKYDAIIGTALQNLSAMNNNTLFSLTSTIFSNSSFKFVFFTGETELDTTRKLLKLSDGEMNKISTPNQRHCLLKAGAEKYYMKVGSFPYESELFGSGGGV